MEGALPCEFAWLQERSLHSFTAPGQAASWWRACRPLSDERAPSNLTQFGTQVAARNGVEPPRTKPMPDLFSPYTLKGVTLRNRIAMSPMTMYRSVDGLMNDYHVMLLGSRAAGGFGLVFPEQLAITPDGRTSTACGGIYHDAQIEGLSRVTSIIKGHGRGSRDPARAHRAQGQRSEAVAGRHAAAAGSSGRLAGGRAVRDPVRRQVHLSGSCAEPGRDQGHS